MDSSFISDTSCKDSVASTTLPNFDLDSQSEGQSEEIGPVNQTSSEKTKANGFSIDSDFKQKYIHYDESEIMLKELLKSMKSVTAREDLIRSLR